MSDRKIKSQTPHADEAEAIAERLKWALKYRRGKVIPPMIELPLVQESRLDR